MDVMKSKIRSGFRTEMMAVGLYDRLADRYEKARPDLAERLRGTAREEEMHGRLFRQCHVNVYGKGPGGERFWRITGTVTAFFMTFVPLEMKLKILSREEHKAVAMIEKELEGGGDTPLLKVLKRILPDERSHASIYGEFFPS